MHDGTTVNEATRPSLVAEMLRIQHEIHAPAVINDPLTRTVQSSADTLLEKQAEEGFWRFDLEADTTIPEKILQEQIFWRVTSTVQRKFLFLQYFLGTVDVTRQEKLADYILSRQLQDGSWPLYEGGPGNISASVKSYFALKLAGKDPA